MDKMEDQSKEENKKLSNEDLDHVNCGFIRKYTDICLRCGASIEKGHYNESKEGMYFMVWCPECSTHCAGWPDNGAIYIQYA